ncbi:MAG: DUF177 domain-containing protein [Phyllobacteriaceae bacterium]|nr:DUF177 domain-containing protein [Phyllobacteriaceae bacterium]
MTTPTPSFPISRPVSPADVPPLGTHVTIEPDAATRAELARLAGALSVESFHAEFLVKPWGTDGYAVEGRVTAELTQACVVTLEPVGTRVDEPVALKLVPPEAMARYEETPDEEGGIDLDPSAEIPDPIEDGVIDLGRVAVEHFLVGVDPYPRKEGAVFDAEAAGVGEGREKTSPFAALARLAKE